MTDTATGPLPTEAGRGGVAALLLLGAIVSALFFNGMRVEYFALSMALLLTWGAVLCWQGVAAGRPLPGGPLWLALLLYLAWLALTLLWNPVPYLGWNYFALLASPVLVVLGWQMLPAPERSWRLLRPLLLLLGLALVGYALYQYYLLQDQPRATFINRNSLAALLILLIPLAFAQLLQSERRWSVGLLLAGIAAAALVVGLVGSRGAFLGLGAALLALALLSRYHRPQRRRIWLGIVAVLLGLGVSSLSFVNTQSRLLTERLGTLSDPYSAGNDRFLIWNQSLAMAAERPLSGYGLGTYWQHWPQWRDPADGTSGFWAHNDFLHLWVEAGLPGPLLLLAVHVALALVAWRLWRSRDIDVARKAESAALFAGLLAVAVHAQFTFIYYNLPILLVIALMLARIARVERDDRGAAGRAAPRWLRLAAPTLAVLGGLYFASIAAAVLSFERAVAHMREGETQQAEQSFVLAQRLWGATDMFYYTHALFLEQQLVAAPKGEVARRRALFERAEGLLERALANSALRPMAHHIHGRLLVSAAELAGDDWLARAEAAFARALARDPRYLESRLTLARILEVTGRQDEADALLEQGMPWSYPGDDPNLLTYYRMVVAARQRAGDRAGALELAERYNALLEAFRERQRREEERQRRE